MMANYPLNGVYISDNLAFLIRSNPQRPRTLAETAPGHVLRRVTGNFASVVERRKPPDVESGGFSSVAGGLCGLFVGELRQEGFGQLPPDGHAGDGAAQGGEVCGYSFGSGPVGQVGGGDHRQSDDGRDSEEEY